MSQQDIELAFSGMPRSSTDARISVNEGLRTGTIVTNKQLEPIRLYMISLKSDLSASDILAHIEFAKTLLSSAADRGCGVVARLSGEEVLLGSFLSYTASLTEDVVAALKTNDFVFSTSSST